MVVNSEHVTASLRLWSQDAQIHNKFYHIISLGGYLLSVNLSFSICKMGRVSLRSRPGDEDSRAPGVSGT